jgi:hypothetical protein
MPTITRTVKGKPTVLNAKKKRIRMLVAPTGSGKSWLAKKYPNQYVDTDYEHSAYNDTEAKFGARWWLSSKQPEAQAFATAKISSWLVEHAPSYHRVLLLADLQAAVEARDALNERIVTPARAVVVLWLPTASTLTQRQEHRVRVTGDDTYPTFSYDQNCDLAASYLAIAQDSDVCIVTGSQPPCIL